MGLAYDLVVGAIIAIISLVVHYIAVSLLAPGTPLFAIAADATTLSGQQRAQTWYQILAMWVPMGGLLVAAAWPMIRAYRRQAVTAGGTRRVR